MSGLRSRRGWLRSDAVSEARTAIAATRRVFDDLAAGGKPGQMLAQGMGNYYETDPVEAENFGRFVAALPPAGRVLVIGCGDAALDAELLVRAGFEVVASDLSPAAVNVARARFDELGLHAEFLVDDVTRLDLAQYEPGFDGVMFAQVAAFIPIVGGSGDSLLVKAIADSISLLSPGGVFFFSTTRYPQTLGRGLIDATYYGRRTEDLAEMIRASGATVTYEQFFDSAIVAPSLAAFDEDTYQNQYLIAIKTPRDKQIPIIGTPAWIHRQAIQMAVRVGPRSTA